MAWQGVPFKFLIDNSQSLNLAIRNLPELVLKTDPDYTSAIITGVVSLVAGVIPASIAIFTFFKNSKIIKNERIEQQAFLKAEHEEQQQFLKEERAAHAASMEADRNTQELIAKRSFDMQVLSANRQAWINKLRELLAEYMSHAPDCLTMQFEFINSKVHFQSISQKKNHFDGIGVQNDALDESFFSASDRLSKSIKNLNDHRVKEGLITGHIKLMLNPREKWYGTLSEIFSNISITWNSLNALDEEVYLRKIAEMRQQIDSCLACSQELLKYEWSRVKKGE